MNFEQLYQLHYVAIYSYLRALLNHDAEAEDICQDTFVSLYQEMKKGGEPDNLRAWLFRVATNKSNNLFRRKKNYWEIIKIRKEEPGDGLEEELFRRERRERVFKAIQKLEERDRQLVLLYHNELSYREMADVMGMNVNSVGKTLSRVIEKLTREIKSEAYELFV